MFNVIGSKEILKNIIRLANPYMQGSVNSETLKRAFLNFLKEVQPKVPKPDTSLSYKWKKEEIAPLLHIFDEDSVLDDFDEIFDLEKQLFSGETLERVQDAVRKMEASVPEFKSIIDLVIHTIFTFPSSIAGGGSTSAAIGCIWVDIRPHWMEQDILEFLVHETTHNLVFVDELCHLHYSSYPEIAKPENFARSAILNKPRPLDKVFHSIVVSTEVLSFRQKYFGHLEKPCLHPPTDVLLDQTIQSIHSIRSQERLLTERAIYLLNQCSDILKQIELGQYCGLAIE